MITEKPSGWRRSAEPTAGLDRARTNTGLKPQFALRRAVPEHFHFSSTAGNVLFLHAAKQKAARIWYTGPTRSVELP